ncbi:urease accessory protein UreD [Massilia yuzhufengensis]|uniref:Urease accessory protein UreD n=1 Tax=Massilia yuzhufengensis TaxID=1164594 RepID=A0A1I1TTD5_9BURK|nr:urease accessory protein UreD [Massilia yuzhufengensis]SFD58780.1 urease accessory protein [Massilia yuzhufengensis]
MRDCLLSPSIVQPGWHASMRLRFARDGDTTRLVERRHEGPLRVQKALYPEGPGVCHAVLVHPPGGVAGGDVLDIGVQAGPGARTLLTSPGAAKWYRANGRPARQQVRLDALSGASIEWLPQETILYDGADVTLEHEVDLGLDATYIGSEILCFGRAASGERFTRGALRQRTRIRHGGRLVWHEQGRLAGGAALDSPLALGGRHVCATLVGVGRPAPAALLASLRAGDAALGVTQLKSVFVARYLCDDSEAARHAMARVWTALRPHLLGLEARAPRIWNT